MWWTAVFEEQWTVSLLPPSSSTPWERALDAVDGDLAARDPVGLIPAARSDKNVPLAWLPYLAAERSVDEFSGTWPEARQRAVVAGSFAVHQRKGVRRALDLALAPLGYQVRVREWFEITPRRRPYTFALHVELDLDTPWRVSDGKQLIRVANGAKNAHTMLDAVRVSRSVPSTTYVGGMPIIRDEIIVRQETVVDELMADAFIFAAATPVIRQTIIVAQRD